MVRSKTKRPGRKLKESQSDFLRSARRIKVVTAARKAGVKNPGVVGVRNSSGLSQAQFALLLGVSVRTLQKWEQGAREPSGAARSLIRIAQRHPGVLADALK